MSFLRSVIDLLLGSKRGTARLAEQPTAVVGSATAVGPVTGEPGRDGNSRTLEVRPPGRKDLRIQYSPSPDGNPDAGEIVWTWVPYEENDGRGKDRPVLVIGQAAGERVYAVKLTSKSHDRDRDYLPIGSGSWDGQGRPSWVDIEQLYSVHPAGMRREAAALDLDTFVKVAAALQRRYGWDARR